MNDSIFLHRRWFRLAAPCVALAQVLAGLETNPRGELYEAEAKARLRRAAPVSAVLWLEYPSATLERSSELFYWQEARFGLKPTIRINHLVIQDRPGATVIASKMLYASHYFWTALELRVLAPDRLRGPGFWFVTISRSRSDGLSGFVGRLIRGRVRNEAVKGTLAVLKATKAGLETQSR